MSFDPDEWTESLRKEYMLVIEGFFTLPFPLFSTTYRRAIKVRAPLFYFFLYEFNRYASLVPNLSISYLFEWNYIQILKRVKVSYHM